MEDSEDCEKVGAPPPRPFRIDAPTLPYRAPDSTSVEGDALRATSEDNCDAITDDAGRCRGEREPEETLEIARVDLT